MQHLTQIQVKRIFNQELKQLFYRSNCEQQQDNDDDDNGCSPTKCHDGEDHVTKPDTSAHVKPSSMKGWPAPLQMEGSLFDICFDGVDGEVMVRKLELYVYVRV